MICITRILRKFRLLSHILMPVVLRKQLQKGNNKWSGQQQTIETIQKTAMTRNATARVFNSNASLE
jgi:hypothetical protein